MEAVGEFSKVNVTIFVFIHAADEVIHLHNEAKVSNPAIEYTQGRIPAAWTNQHSFFRAHQQIPAR